MLSEITSVTLYIDGTSSTFLITDCGFSYKDNESVSWSGSCRITDLCKVHNSPSFILVKLDDSTGIVLSVEQCSFNQIVRLTSCPSAVYYNSDTLIYNSETTCCFFNLKSGKTSVSINHAVVGYDFRSMKYIFRKEINSFLEVRFSKFQSYKNDCLNSVGSLPISWVSVVSDRALVLGTSLNRVMYVYDGIITSNYGLPHDIQFITKGCDLRVNVVGGSSSTSLTVPVLGPCKLSGEQAGTPHGQLVQSCDSLIKNEMRTLHNLYRVYEKKLDFLVDVWNELFEFGETDTDLRASKRRKGASLLQREKNLETQFYQIPRAPKRFARTSTFIDSSSNITVYCSNPKLPVLGISGRFASPEIKILNAATVRAAEFEITPRFREKLRTMFAETLIGRPESPELEALSYLVYYVLSQENGIK